MKQYTRFLKDEARKDYARIMTINNSKDRKRTAEAIRQSRHDRAEHYRRKWHGYLAEATIDAQKHYCQWMLTLCDRVEVKP